jgi:hypothetical protein
MLSIRPKSIMLKNSRQMSELLTYEYYNKHMNNIQSN